MCPDTRRPHFIESSMSRTLPCLMGKSHMTQRSQHDLIAARKERRA